LIAGSESVALKVAEFVVRAFQTTRKPTNPYDRRDHRPYGPNEPPADSSESEENFAQENKPNYNLHEAPNPMAPLKYIVRLFGLEPNQISAVAVNALVFVAQMVRNPLKHVLRSFHEYFDY
jgi:hypothetical protein